MIPAPNEGDVAAGPFFITQTRTAVGRAADNDWVLNDREVSKYHAEIVAHDSGYSVVDLKSSNGTFVNGKKIAVQRLEERDAVEFGSCRFLFALGQVSGVSVRPDLPVEQTKVIATKPVGDFSPADQLANDDLRRSYQRVRVAFEAICDLAAVSDLDKLCQRILSVSFELVQAESGAVLLLKPDGALQPTAVRSRHGSDDNEINISRTIVDKAVNDKSAVLASDALEDGRWSPSQSMLLGALRSVLCVPLLREDHVHGVLHLGASKEIGAFSEDDLDLISSLGAAAGVALGAAMMSSQLATEASAREQLGRFLSPVLVEQALQGSLDLRRGGDEREVTVLFSDIRGYTSLTERSHASEIVSMLNDYFDQMVEIVFTHGGLLDKFIGDALMAVWGTPIRRPDDGGRAVAAAQEMLHALGPLNEARRNRGAESIHIGIGLASGRCVAGNIGARRRMEFTVIGDAVNLAARLSSRATSGQILADEATYLAAGQPPQCNKLEPAAIKGKTLRVPIFEMLG